MKREGIILMRDQAFETIAAAFQSGGPVSTWSADERMALTMTQLVYHAACTQLAQLDGDDRDMHIIVLLDMAKGHLYDAMQADGENRDSVQKARLAIVEALDVLEE